MPFAFFRPDGPPRGPGSNGSFSSFNSSSSDSPNYSRQPALSTSLNTSCLPPPNPLTPETTLRCEPEQELRPIVDLRNPGTPPPRLPFLSTPLGSNIRPLLKQHRAQRTDEHLSFYRVVKMKPLESPLRALTPDTLQSLRESRESPCILHVTPSEFADWHARYPGIDESNSHYEYDSVTERMIIKCMAGPVHDSFPIYFFRAIHAGLRQAGPQCHRGLQLFTSTDFRNFKGKYRDTYTRKSPDAYIKVAGVRGFPTVVVEVGWAESMENLMDGARLWLLGTAGQTKVVIIVQFTEASRDHAPSSSNSPETDAEDTGRDYIPELTEESILLGAVNKTTRFSVLAEAVLDLHLLGALAKPLLGHITATFHVFRRTAEDTVYEDFTTTVLPAPEPSAGNDPPQTYALTLADIYGDSPVPAGEDPHQRLLVDMDDFRREIAFQVPDMEVKRSLDRAQAVLEGEGFWENKPTFADAKQAKRKRDEEGDSEAAYQDKRVK